MKYDGQDTAITQEQNSAKPPMLLQEVRNRLRLKHYSIRTEQAYLYWIRRYIVENGKVHPRELGGFAVEGFLSKLTGVG